MPAPGTEGYLGRWSLAGRAIDVVRQGAEIIVITLGVPEEFAPRLVRDDADPTLAVLRGGNLDGTTVRLLTDGEAESLLLGDVITIPRWNDECVSPPVRTHPLPPLTVEPKTEVSYRTMLNKALNAQGAAVVPLAGIDLAAWVRWVTQQDMVLFHGSRDGDIETLIPRRTSYEINNQAGRGNLAAVYATHAGPWAMWFSIVDRSRVRGSIRSGTEEHVRPDGVRLPAYYFSLDYRQLSDPPFDDGWLYLLPRDSFERQPVFPGGPPSPEWCSRQEIRPLARIPVRPRDFPFLDRIGGHDDGDLLRYNELADVVRKHVKSADPTPHGIVLTLVWSQTLADIIDEYITLGRTVMPDIACILQHDEQRSARLHLRTTPDLARMLHATFQDLARRFHG
jgi:hypothetical protein